MQSNCLQENVKRMQNAVHQSSCTKNDSRVATVHKGEDFFVQIYVISGSVTRHRGAVQLIYRVKSVTVFFSL